MPQRRPGTAPQRALLPEPALGALAGILGAVVVMPLFYPLGRLFDPSIGGDTPTSLLAEMALGLAGGLLISPIAALIGALVARWLAGRPISIPLALGMSAIPAVVAAAVSLAANSGPTDPDGSTSSLRFAIVLGAMQGVVAVVVFELARRWSAHLATSTTLQPEI